MHLLDASQHTMKLVHLLDEDLHLELFTSHLQAIFMSSPAEIGVLGAHALQLRMQVRNLLV